MKKFLFTLLIIVFSIYFLVEFIGDRLIKNILQVGQQYWFSVTTLYVAFAIDQDETSTTSIGRSARHLAFPNSIYHEQTCIPPLIPIDTNAYYEHLLMLESQDSSTIQLSNIAEDEMACCEKDEYFQDNSLENSTEMSGNDLILYKLCKPCQTNAICEGRSYKLIRPKKGSWKVDWKEPQIALQYLPCLKEVAKISLKKNEMITFYNGKSEYDVVKKNWGFFY